MIEGDVFSVVIPAYNGGELWKAAVDSILMQDYPAIELIFADDCTPDFDVEIVRAYIEANKRENLVRYAAVRQEENMGTVRNLRKAHELCTGRYLTHIAMDDAYCDEAVLSRYAAALEQKANDVLGVYAKSVVCDEALHSLGYVSFDTRKAQAMNGMTAAGQFGELARRCCIHMGATAFMREEFMAQGDFDIDYRLLEDWPFFLKAVISGKRFLFLDSDAIFYRNGGVTDAKFSSRAKRLCCMDHIRMFERRILPNLHLLPLTKQACVYAKYALDRMDMSFIYGRMSEMSMWERMKKYGIYLPLEALMLARRKWRYVLVWLVCMPAAALTPWGMKACAAGTGLILCISVVLETIRNKLVKRKLIEGKI